MNQTDNSFFKRVSPLYLGRPSDQRGLAPCVEALTAAGIPVIFNEGRYFLTIEDVARAVAVLRPLVGEQTPIGRAADVMLDGIDHHLASILRVTPEGLPIWSATREEIEGMTGGYYPEGY